MKKTVPAGLIAALLFSASANAAPVNVQITEWMYSGTGGEFIEFTNLGTSAVDFTGWSYDDDSRTPGVFDLSGFGLVGAGESVVITEDTAVTFRADWKLAASVKVLGGYTNNIGRADEINLFDAGNTLVDRFAYGDAVYPGTIRTQGKSGTPANLAALAPQFVTADWVFASAGDSFGSYASNAGDIGNPGAFTLAVPEPETYALMLAGLGLVGFAAKRASKS
ncbi:MAG: lamin tail domain-containing protein [Pseudomonadota bacterium]